jgi:malonyl-CoA/methylmalonyl-CoA synthetase
MALDLLADGSLVGRLLRRWSERGSARQLQGVDGGWLGADELEARTRDAAQRLLGAGLEPGGRFILSGPTSVDLVIAYVGALRAGLVVVPLNPAYTETEVARIVRDARPAAAAVADSNLAAWVGEASEGPVRLLGPELDLPAANGGVIDAVGPADPALLIYTSGTTGRPKGALLSQGNLLASATAVNLAWRWTPEDRLLLALPLFHVHGLGVGLGGSLCAGAEIVLRPKFDAADVADRSRDTGVTLFFGVPTMYQRLVESGSIGALSRLRLLVSGSAPLPAALAQQISEQAGQLPLERYGMTETVMLTSNPCEGKRKPGTVGFALPGVEVRLDDSGEVQVRGLNVIAGYYERPEANAEAYAEDGWFRTGDLGRLVTGGRLEYIGRLKDMMRVGGENVAPAEVEALLVTHPAVKLATVAAVPDPRLLEVPAAWIELQPGAQVSEEELIEHCRGQIARYKLPRYVRFVEEWPMSATKIQKRHLVERLVAELGLSDRPALTK